MFFTKLLVFFKKNIFAFLSNHLWNITSYSICKFYRRLRHQKTPKIFKLFISKKKFELVCLLPFIYDKKTSSFYTKSYISSIMVHSLFFWKKNVFVTTIKFGSYFLDIKNNFYLIKYCWDCGLGVDDKILISNVLLEFQQNYDIWKRTWFIKIRIYCN